MKYLIDTHTHTIASGHAYNTMDEMTKYAEKIGLVNLAITDHAPKMPGSSANLYFYNLHIVPRQKYGVHRFMGCELNIRDYNGKVDLNAEILKQMDIVIASLHLPCIQPGTIDENTTALIRCCENPLIHIIGHPDDGRYPVNYEALVDAAAKTHTLIELNNASLNAAGPRQGAYENDIKLLKLCKEKDVCICLGSDAHIEELIGVFDNCEKVLNEVDFPERLIANLDMELMESYLNKGTKRT